jgi:hypothetical protein
VAETALERLKMGIVLEYSLKAERAFNQGLEMLGWFCLIAAESFK